MRCKHVYTDNSKEFKNALDELGLSHDTSTPHRSETNGVGERAVRRVKEGTACALSQSGFIDIWRVEAMTTYCFLRNVFDIWADGPTPYFKRYGVHFTGPIIPFGAEIIYQPISAKDKARTHQFEKKVLHGIFLGYHQIAGGGWGKDLWVVDWEELENAEHVSQVHHKRFKADEVRPVMIGGKFLFPLAEGDLSQPGLSSTEGRRRKMRKRRRRRRRSKII